MAGEWSRRTVLGLLATAPAAMMASAASAQTTPAPATTPAVKVTGSLTDDGLGKLLRGLKVQSTLVDKRYDFGYKSKFNDDEWELSMSAVLSQDAESVWIMAWLEELPKSAADVPRTALLRLLSDNDKLGQGKFFAYIASNRRFVLQRVIPSTGLTEKQLGEALDDLGTSVVMTHPHWSVANWNLPVQEDPSQQSRSGSPAGGAAPQQIPQPLPKATTEAPARPPVTSAVNDKSIPVRR